MFDLLLIRHGQTEWNVQRRVMGMRPIGLTPVGHGQMEALAGELAGVALDALSTSPACRAVESAAWLCKLRPGLTPTEDAAFAEIDYGEWVDRPFDEVEHTEAFANYMLRPSRCTVPGGESIVAVQARALAGVEALRRQYSSGRVAVVSHADVIKAILVHYLGMPLDAWQRPRIDNASLTLLRFRGGRVRVLGYNLYPHWQRLFAPDKAPWSVVEVVARRKATWS